MERRLVLNLSELEIQGNSNGTIHIKWSPKEAGCWRDILQLTDNRRIKYDIIIMTTAKIDNKSNKIRKKLKPAISLSNLSNLSTSMANKQFHQNNTLKVPTIDQSIGNNFDIQVKQCKSKCESDLNKENILNKNNETETYASQAKNRINGMCYNGYEKFENILCEQNINVWSDSSILPQVLLPSNVPQDIRRATYIKEKRPCSSILYEHNEEVDENMESDNDKVQSDFSILLNKFTFTSTDVIASSPEPARRESTESTTSQIVDKHKTFNISRGQFFETSAIYDTKAPVNASVLQPCLHNLSPIKSDGCSLITDSKDLISSSPIQFQHHIPKESNEYTKHFTVDINPNIQTSNYEYFTFEVIPKSVAAKKTEDMYIEISPPKKNFHSKMVSKSVSKLNSARAGRITKNNTLYEDGNRKKLQLNVSATSELYLFKKIIFSIILILTYVL